MDYQNSLTKVLIYRDRLNYSKKNKDFASSVNKICDRNPLQFATTLKPCGRLNYLTKKFLFAITKVLP
jgi:hypothetical protein